MMCMHLCAEGPHSWGFVTLQLCRPFPSYAAAQADMQRSQRGAGMLNLWWCRAVVSAELQSSDAADGTSAGTRSNGLPGPKQGY